MEWKLLIFLKLFTCGEQCHSLGLPDWAITQTASYHDSILLRSHIDKRSQAWFRSVWLDWWIAVYQRLTPDRAFVREIERTRQVSWGLSCCPSNAKIRKQLSVTVMSSKLHPSQSSLTSWSLLVNWLGTITRRLETMKWWAACSKKLRIGIISGDQEWRLGGGWTRSNWWSEVICGLFCRDVCLNLLCGIRIDGLCHRSKFHSSF
jgi:hypothetical protein